MCKRKCIYDSRKPLKVTMYTGTGTVVFDFRNPTTDPYYVYTKNHISFVVELNRNDDPLIDQVYVVTANDNKQTTYIRCAYDDTKNAWVGSHNYSGSTDAPIGLDVQIIMKDAVPPELEEEFVEDLEQEYQQILDAFDKKMEQTRAELEKEIILPNLKEMTIDEVISYTQELQADTSALQKETEDTLRRNLQAKGLVIEKTDSGKKVSNGTNSISYQEERLDHVDQEEQRQKGYDPMPIPGRKPMYIKTADKTVVIIDPNTKSRIICELESYMGDEVDFNDPSSLLSYKSIAEDFKEYFYGEIKAPDNYYEWQWKKLTKNNIRTQISMQELDEKIFDLKQINADPDLIRNYENQYDALRSLEALQSDELGDLTKQMRSMDLLESLELFDFVSLGLSAQSLGESIDKGATLRLVYSALLSSCADNEEFQRLDREISTMSTCMNVAATGGVIIDTVSIFATGLNPLVGALLGAASFGAQKLADYNLNKEYDRIGNKLKTPDCNGDGIPDYLEELGLPMEKHVAIDPSGYVYEAVPSNRLEGVRAEVYYRGYPLDEYGVPSEEPVDILWDAENYDQVNPQYTDAEGRYHWDVPIGLWLVKYSKGGLPGHRFLR